MKKKIIIIVLVLLVAFFVIFKLTTPSNETILLKEHESFKKININNVYSITVNTYTEGGLETEEYKDKTDIEYIYNKLANIEIGEETEMACEDNTISYVFNFTNGASMSVSKECDWIILDNKRYLIK